LFAFLQACLPNETALSDEGCLDIKALVSAAQNLEKNEGGNFRPRMIPIVD